MKVQAKVKDSDVPKALCVAYIDARDVMERLDEVFEGNWQDTYRTVSLGGREGIECSLTVNGVTRTDVGDIADQMGGGDLKAGYSDAFKRAGVKFGIGRFLYDLPKMYAETDQSGKYIKKEEIARLQKMIVRHLELTNDVAEANKKVAEIMKSEPEAEEPQGFTYEQAQFLFERGYAKHPKAGGAMLRHSTVITADTPNEALEEWAIKYREARKSNDVQASATIADESIKLV